MGYTVTGPKINIVLGQGAPSAIFTKEEIDGFFKSLPVVVNQSHTVDVSGNIGSLQCDASIASSKGYIVITQTL
jgi:hypothetical protein